jgi:hypothetical protein
MTANKTYTKVAAADVQQVFNKSENYFRVLTTGAFQLRLSALLTCLQSVDTQRPSDIIKND